MNAREQNLTISHVVSVALTLMYTRESSLHTVLLSAKPLAIGVSLDS